MEKLKININETSAERLERYKKILLKIIINKLPNTKVYLFGSRARSDHSQGSDIDLALDNAGKKIDFKIILNIYSKIEETSIPLTIDLVDLNNIDSNFKKAIEKERISWKN